MLNVFFIGLVSFFTDTSTEMVYPLIPLYLISVFGATPRHVGLIEGLAESIASLLKVYSGYISDKFQRKKPIAFFGYSTGLIYKFLLILASSWPGILFARILDRLGKGIRTAPRDVLVSESVGANMGKAFGLHKSLDMGGAAIGILMTYFFLNNMGENTDYKNLFLISTIPAVLGLLMFIFIKEQKSVSLPRTESITLIKSFRALDGQLKLYLLVVLLFTLGNSSNAFLLMKAKAVGFDDITVILLYFVYNVTASVFSLPLGRLSDTIGRKRLLVTGYFIFCAVYLGFAGAFSRLFLAAMFVLYGLHTAMIAGVERAYVAEIAPRNLKGTMLGLQSTVAGLALLPASLITGALWDVFGEAIPFLFGAAMSGCAAIVLLIYMKSKDQRSSSL